MTQQQKIAAALLKSGVTSPVAWAAAGFTPSAVALNQNPNGPSHAAPANDTQVSPASAFDPHPAVVLMKGNNNPTFLISWRSQQDFVRSLTWKSAAMIWCGAALTLLGIYVLLQQMELQ